MSFPGLRLLVSLSLASLVSCSNTVNLDSADRASASRIHISREVKRPEQLGYTDHAQKMAMLPGAMFGAVGAGIGAAIVVAATKGTVEDVNQGFFQSTGDPGAVFRKELAAAIQRRKFATVTEGSDYKSRLDLEFKKMWMRETGMSSNQQYLLEVHATLTDRNGKVIWKTYHGSYPHNDQLPARTTAEYLANPKFLGQDFQATCRYVAELMADDLKWQMVDDE